MVSGPDPLDPLHLINLASSADRLERFTRRNAHLDNVVRYEAVDGSRLDRRSLVSRGYATDDLSYGDGTLGSAMSHVALWEKIKDQPGMETNTYEGIVAGCNNNKERHNALLPYLEKYYVVKFSEKY